MTALRDMRGALLLVVLLALEVGPAYVLCQGLRNDPGVFARSGSTFATFTKAYKDSVAWRNAMKVSTATACSRQAGSLCSSSTDAGQQAALQIAAAPQLYDARSPLGRPGLQVLTRVKEQGNCGACVAFTVLAAAQTAAAMALRNSFRDTLSEHDFYFCRTVQQGFVRNCDAGLSMLDGVSAWLRLQRAGTLPVTAACLPYDVRAGSQACRPACTTTLPQLLGGSFLAEPLSSVVNMQRHIRRYGSIMCRMLLYSDVKPFFAANKTGVYPGPGAGATYQESHAVQVVGYDNTRQAWLIKNSWGPGFAVKGFAWVSFGAPGMCDPQDTYGFIFNPQQPPAVARPNLTAVVGKAGCYRYTAADGDYPEGLASQLEVDLAQLLLENLAVIKDPSTVPAGTQLLLCGVSPAALAGATVIGGPPRAAPAGIASAPLQSNSSTSSNVSDEVAALLAIKRVLDPPGTALKDWQPGSNNPCAWTGIVCDRTSQRVRMIGSDDPSATTAAVELSGQLPGGALLRRLPALRTIGLDDTGVGGPLPEDWSQLVQLEGIYLNGNALTGTLPPSWGFLSKLRYIYMDNNKLSGPLPPAWSGLAALEQLTLANNALTGTVPATWSSWGRAQVVTLYGNRQLTGCVPAAWKGKVNVGRTITAEGPYKGGDPLTAGTDLTGFC